MLADMVLVVIVNWGFGIGCCCRLFDEMGIHVQYRACRAGGRALPKT